MKRIPFFYFLVFVAAATVTLAYDDNDDFFDPEHEFPIWLILDEDVDIEPPKERNLSEYRCYEKGPKRGEYWALKWTDKFKVEAEKDPVAADWSVIEEDKYCSGHGVDHVSCDIAANVHLHKGLLVLGAAHQTYYTHRYTGAQVFTHADQSFDRIEVRAAQPLGSHLHTSIFAYNDINGKPKVDKSLDFEDYASTYYKQEVGWIEVASNIQKPSIMHGIHQQKADKVYLERTGADHVYKDHELQDLHQFHRYGMLWNTSVAQFFFDANATKPIPNHLNSINTKFQLVLMIGVGGTWFHEPVPADYSALNWLCPALIIDYIRLWDKVTSTGNLKPCVFPADTSNELIEEVCRLAREYAQPKNRTESMAEPQKAEAEADSGWSDGPIILAIILIGALLVPVAIFLLIRAGILENPVDRLRAMYQKDDAIMGYEREAELAQSVNGFDV